MKRHDLILTIVLVVQVALSAVVFWPKSATSSGGEPVFAGVEADTIVALTVTDDQGNSIVLRKAAGAWLLPEAGDYPAQVDKIAPVLEKIVGLNTDRLVTDTDASHKRLQVAADRFMRRVAFETGDGANHVLYLGSSPSYGVTHFRLDGQSEVYLAKDLTSWELDATAAGWVDTAYFSIGREELTRVTLENGNGTFVFTKGDDDSWVLVGLVADEELDSGEVDTLISKVTSVTMLGPLGTEEDAAYGMDDPAAVVTLEARDRTVTLQVGAQDPDDNSYVVKVSESPYYVRVAGSGFQPLVENTRDDFMVPPPTPGPSPTPGK